ncbi:UNKNOWN [Stylonychia lemnae]|uniref:Uncharacterized protein n=1 Tax=Stylonychia lemnae TaxID=5949 RepID=A0A077ZTE6_STYLE|nr:UNKNOWN [Stylonychia lemnae]|eukprot:CDW72605.1 UNKNOWN [Stylonychia lemnae]
MILQHGVKVLALLFRALNMPRLTVSNLVFIPGICLLIKNKFYYVRIKESVMNMTMPAQTGWSFISLYLTGNLVTQASQINQVQLMTFHNNMRGVSPLKTFKSVYHDDHDCTGTCSICSLTKSSCLEYDISDTTLLLHGWDFNNKQKAYLNLDSLASLGGSFNFFATLFFQDVVIIKDSGLGGVKLAGSQINCFATANHGVYLNGTGFVQSMSELTTYQDRAFTFEIYFRTDIGFKEKAYLNLSLNVNLNGSIAKIEKAFDSLNDLHQYLFFGFSIIKRTASSTLVCMYIQSTFPKESCQIIEKLYATNQNNDGLNYRMIKIGKGFDGIIRSAYIWSYAKGIDSMKITALPKKNCKPESNAPQPFCLSCDSILGNSKCFDSCNLTNIGGYPCLNSYYDCPDLCMTCEKNTTCSHCIAGTNNCTSSCLNLGNQYFEPTLNSCQDCPINTFTIDGKVCLKMTNVEFKNLTDDYKIDILFSRNIIIVPETTLYDDDDIIVKIRYQDAFLDQYGKGVLSNVYTTKSKFYQYNSSEQNSYYLGLASQITLSILIAISGLASILFSVSIESTWGIIYAIQVMLLMPGMKINYPANALKYLDYLGFCIFDFDNLQNLFNYLVVEKSKFDQSYFTYYLFRIGFDSKYIFNNVGDLILLWMLVIMLYPVLLYFKLTLKHEFWMKHLDNAMLKQSTGILFLDFKANRPIYLMYHWTFVLRRLTIGFALVYLKDDNEAQLYTFIISSMFILLWHSALRQFKSTLTNVIMIICDLAIIGINTICFVFADETLVEDSSNKWVICSIILIPCYIFKSRQMYLLWMQRRDIRIREECEKKYLITGAEKKMFQNPLSFVKIKGKDIQPLNQQSQLKVKKSKSKQQVKMQSLKEYHYLKEEIDNDLDLKEQNENYQNHDQDFKKLTWSRVNIQERVPKSRASKHIAHYQQIKKNVKNQNHKKISFDFDEISKVNQQSPNKAKSQSKTGDIDQLSFVDYNQSADEMKNKKLDQIVRETNDHQNSQGSKKQKQITRKKKKPSKATNDGFL